MRMTFILGGSVILIIMAVAFLGGCTAGAMATSPGTPTITGLPATPTDRVKNALEIAAQNQIIIAETQQIEDAIAKKVGDRQTATAQLTVAAATQVAQAKIDAGATQDQRRSDASTQQARQDAASTQAKVDAVTAQARSDNMTRQAKIDDMTDQAWKVTVTAAVIGTQTAFPMTAAVIPDYQTAEVGSLHAQGTQVTGNAELTHLTVERQTMKNPLDAYGPWVSWALFSGAFCLGLYFFLQYRELKRDKNGMLGGELIKHKGGVTVLRPDNMTGSAMTINKMGQITETGSDTDFQQATTRRQQLVEASKGKTIPELKQVVGMFGAPGPVSSGVKYFDADRMLGKILGDAEEDLVDGEVTDV